MDDQQSTKMPKPFDSESDLNVTPMETPSSPQQFVIQEEDGLKQEDDYRQGSFVFFSKDIKLRFSFIELMKVQDEIVTLRQVLSAKLKRENELKSLLGIRFVDDLKHDWQETVHDIKTSTAFQKTAETFQAASSKLVPAIQSVNTTVKSSLGSLRSI